MTPFEKKVVEEMFAENFLVFNKASGSRFLDEEKLKSFLLSKIREAREEERERTREIVEDMKINAPYPNASNGYARSLSNEALSDILSALSKKLTMKHHIYHRLTLLRDTHWMPDFLTRGIDRLRYRVFYPWEV